ncbi:hypothetical protein FACS1894184_17110 [Clostridia bacterium]|nr:hypothetical protein FACS1894184_17110 [Clostridia bacterium]
MNKDEPRNSYTMRVPHSVFKDWKAKLAANNRVFNGFAIQAIQEKIDREYPKQKPA